MLRSAKAFTLVEVLAASLIAAVVAGGTLMAFVTAARIVRRGSTIEHGEASLLASDLLEKIRNRVATSDYDLWFSSHASVTAPSSWSEWISDADSQLPAGGGARSILNARGAERKYLVRPEDCDGDGLMGDCYAVTVKVCWDGCPP
jgi:prepilin-type N-terminal cleavage/methylation domain-containing protein